MPIEPHNARTITAPRISVPATQRRMTVPAVPFSVAARAESERAAKVYGTCRSIDRTEQDQTYAAGREAVMAQIRPAMTERTSLTQHEMADIWGYSFSNVSSRIAGLISNGLLIKYGAGIPIRYALPGQQPEPPLHSRIIELMTGPDKSANQIATALSANRPAVVSALADLVKQGDVVEHKRMSGSTYGPPRNDKIVTLPPAPWGKA